MRVILLFSLFIYIVIYIYMFLLWLFILVGPLSKGWRTMEEEEIEKGSDRWTYSHQVPQQQRHCPQGR